MYSMLIEEHSVDFPSGAWFDHSSSDVTLSVAHRRESKFGEYALYVLIAIMHWNAVECVKDRYVHQPVSIVIKQLGKCIFELV